MKRSIVLGALISLALAAPALAAEVGSASAFTGAWETTDVDGSHEIMALSGAGGDTLRVAWIDDYATICARAGVPGTAVMLGTASSDGIKIGVSLDGVRCPKGVVLPFPAVAFYYDPAADTLWGPVTPAGSGFATTWHRMSGRR